MLQVGTVPACEHGFVQLIETWHIKDIKSSTHPWHVMDSHTLPGRQYDIITETCRKSRYCRVKAFTMNAPSTISRVLVVETVFFSILFYCKLYLKVTFVNCYLWMFNANPQFSSHFFLWGVVWAASHFSWRDTDAWVMTCVYHHSKCLHDLLILFCPSPCSSECRN